MNARYRSVQVAGRTQYEHRLIAAQKIGRELLPGEQVHHVNGDTFDNRPENLEVLLHGDHRRLHRLERCARGHELTEANVYVRPDNAQRMCRTCRHDYAVARAARRKAARHARGLLRVRRA